MLGQIVIALAVVLGFWLIYSGLSGRRRGRAPFEFPLLLLIVLILGSGMLLFWGNAPDFPATLVIGLLVAGAALFGLFFNALVSREDAERLRIEKREDVQRALVAEIKHYTRALEQFPVDDIFAEMAPRIRAGHVPVIPSECNDTVFQVVVGQIHVLPKDVIDPVVKYYSQIKEIEAAIADLRAPFFTDGCDETAIARRLEMYRDYLGVKLRALDYGRDALAAMGAEPTRDEEDVSSPDDVRSME